MNAAARKTQQRKSAVTQPADQAPDKSKAQKPVLRVVETGACPSLTGRSTLGFEVGRDTEQALWLRIKSNSGTGKFSKEWMPLTGLMQALEKASVPITCSTLQGACKHKSANNSGFLLAVFRHKGLVQQRPDKQRGYALGPAFSAGAKQLTQPTQSGAAAKPLKAKAAGKAKAK